MKSPALVSTTLLTWTLVLLPLWNVKAFAQSLETPIVSNPLSEIRNTTSRQAKTRAYDSFNPITVTSAGQILDSDVAFCRKDRQSSDWAVYTGISDYSHVAGLNEMTYSVEDVASGSSQGWRHEWKHYLWSGMCYTKNNLWSDFTNNYSCENLGLMAAGIAVAAPLANTQVDDNFSGWYQRDVRSETSDDLSRYAKVFGDHEVLVPIYLGVIAAGWLASDFEAGSAAEEWSRRTLRAMIVGAPAVGVLQYGLGGHRPNEGSSQWRPFDDTNGVAGHTFIGALPFLTAASMTENRVAKAAFFAGSFLTGWSRLNDDAHTLSQNFLGWWLAYLAVESVNRTERRRNFILTPMTGPGDIGINVMISY